jgi:hypothetical protein
MNLKLKIMKTLYIIIDLASLEAAKERLSDIADLININTFSIDVLIIDIESAKKTLSYLLRDLTFEFKTF